MISRYIDNKELKRVIEDGKIKPYRIKNMLKNEGILLVSKNAEQIAEQVYPILWGSSDIQKMSQSIDDSGNYIKSSIIEIEIEDATEIINEIDDLFANAPYGKSKYSLMSAHERMITTKAFKQDKMRFLNTKDFPVLVGAEKLKYCKPFIFFRISACIGV